MNTVYILEYALASDELIHFVGWTRVWTSRMLKYDTCHPSVVECLFYWLSSATMEDVNLPGVFKVPEVGDWCTLRPFLLGSDAGLGP